MGAGCRKRDEGKGVKLSAAATDKDALAVEAASIGGSGTTPSVAAMGLLGSPAMANARSVSSLGQGVASLAAEVVADEGKALSQPMSGTRLADHINAAGPDQLVVICFFDPDCGACDGVQSFYEGLMHKYRDVFFLDADISRNIGIVEALHLKSVPTFVVFREHREIGRYEGTRNDAIEELVANCRSQNT